MIRKSQNTYGVVRMGSGRVSENLFSLFGPFAIIGVDGANDNANCSSIRHLDQNTTYQFDSRKSDSTTVLGI